ncbi:MAG: SAM-dependent methyltransferase [Cyanobacteria bacterium DS2.3.42]|nr:SAM-dependent methyltransferase [Cyanobacteria bacterium DS2.3.42]
MTTPQPLSSSFRDPNGFVFEEGGDLYRKVRVSYSDNYKQLIHSGLYITLVGKGLLVAHEDSDIAVNRTGNTFKILKPARVPFISYPYEWSFSQLKSAALATLQIQRYSLESGMTLKDASAYNIQFFGITPALIDTLSFEIYEPGTPWTAYRQFCQHFLAPLALMAYIDLRLSGLMQHHIDGIPLDLACKLLPKRAMLNGNLLMHLYLHSRLQSKFEGAPTNNKRSFPKQALLGLIDSLEQAICSIHLPKCQSNWSDYYDCNSYSAESAEKKLMTVRDMLMKTKPQTVFDFGANCGRYSRVAADLGAMTISLDMDPLCVQKNFLDAASHRDDRILPLVIDLTAPTPSIGWSNNERSSLIERGPCDTGLALALVHHLAIANNVPFARIAEFFSLICKNLIIEFVPKSDVQVKRLLASRKDIFETYTQEHFESEFLKFFEIIELKSLEESGRILYLMKLRADL